MKTILTTAILLGSVADSLDSNSKGQVRAVKLMAKADEVMEQAAEAMSGIASSLGESSLVDEGMALKAEALVEADALADLEVEERLIQDQKHDEQSS